jgi:2-dehydro-3-deoxygalactonokinase
VYLATIDCGTTNSRVYIVNEEAQVIAKATREVGVRDTAIHGSNQRLKEGLKETFLTALAQARLHREDMAFVLSSGMITSEIGLLEVPHLWAPTPVDDLARNLVKVHDTAVFPVDLPIYFIPGIKNRYDPQTATIRDVGMLDFMRGEEVQVAGLLAAHAVKPPLTAVVLSSHTKFIPIDEGRNVLGSITTLSGQIYAALIKATSIGKSISEEEGDGEEIFDEEIVDIAHEQVRSAGFLRAMLMPRFLDTLIKTRKAERKLFVQAAIASEDMRVLDRFEALHFPGNSHFVLIGPRGRCDILAHLLRTRTGMSQGITALTDPETIDMLSIKGAIYLSRVAGLL